MKRVIDVDNDRCTGDHKKNVSNFFSMLIRDNTLKNYQKEFQSILAYISTLSNPINDPDELRSNIVEKLGKIMEIGNTELYINSFFSVPVWVPINENEEVEMALAFRSSMTDLKEETPPQTITSPQPPVAVVSLPESLPLEVPEYASPVLPSSNYDNNGNIQNLAIASLDRIIKMIQEQLAANDFSSTTTEDIEKRAESVVLQEKKMIDDLEQQSIKNQQCSDRLTDREKQLAENVEALNNKSKQLELKESELQEKENDLKKKEKEIEKKTQELELKESDIQKEREQLEKKLEELEQKSEELEHQKEALQHKEEELSDYNTKLQTIISMSQQLLPPTQKPN